MGNNTPIIQELEDGRILKWDGSSFEELIDGQWVEPQENFSLDDFINGDKPDNI